MIRLILLVMGLLAINSCSNPENTIDTTVPNCIRNIINDTISSNELKTVRVQEVDKELHYWLNTDFAHFDGFEYIVNSKCDTICGICGECLPSDCLESYKEQWVIIWED